MIHKQELAVSGIALVEFGSNTASRTACRKFVEDYKNLGLDIDWYYFDIDIGIEGLNFELKNLLPFYQTVLLYKHGSFHIVRPEQLDYQIL